MHIYPVHKNASNLCQNILSVSKTILLCERSNPQPLWISNEIETTNEIETETETIETKTIETKWEQDWDHQDQFP